MNIEACLSLTLRIEAQTPEEVERFAEHTKTLYKELSKDIGEYTNPRTIELPLGMTLQNVTQIVRAGFDSNGDFRIDYKQYI